jgi:hypothetical protein
MCNMTLGQTQMSDGFFAQSVPYLEKALVPFVDDSDTDRSYRVKIRALLATAFEETGKLELAAENWAAISNDTGGMAGGELIPVYPAASGKKRSEVGPDARSFTRQAVQGNTPRKDPSASP